MLLDSDVIIELPRDDPRVVQAPPDLAAAGIRTNCTPIAWVEVYRGLRAGEAAATTGLRLWTLNRRHYPMKDLRFFEAEQAG